MWGSAVIIFLFLTWFTHNDTHTETYKPFINVACIDNTDTHSDKVFKINVILSIYYPSLMFGYF